MLLRVGIEESRYINLREYETKKRSLNDLFYTYKDKAFKQIARMNKISFNALLELISDHPVFHNTKRNRYVC